MFLHPFFHMYYKLIKVKQINDDFHVNIDLVHEEPEEREPIPTGCPGHAWMYFPVTISDQEAVDILRKYIRKSLLQDLQKITKLLNTEFLQ